MGKFNLTNFVRKSIDQKKALESIKISNQNIGNVFFFAVKQIQQKIRQRRKFNLILLSLGKNIGKYCLRLSRFSFL
jgi:hypothetical protein